MSLVALRLEHRIDVLPQRGEASLNHATAEISAPFPKARWNIGAITREWGGPTLLLIASLAVFAATKGAILEVSHLKSSPFWMVLATFIFAILTSSVRYSVLSSAPRIIIRAIAMMVLFQVACEAFGAVYGAPNILFDEGPDLLFFRYGAVIGLIAGVLSWFRPSFALCLLTHYVLFRERISAINLIPVVRTDYMSMTDIALFATVGTLLVVALTQTRVMSKLPEAVKGLMTNRDIVRDKTWLLIWGVGVGAHLGNYFYSGLEKIRATENQPLIWLLENPTRTPIVMGLERGDNPFGAFPTIVQFLWDAITFGTPIINPLVLGFQCLVIFASINRRTLLTFTVFFDLFHLVVYATLGAIFQFWIFVNIIVFASVMTIPKEKYTNAVRLAIFLATIGGFHLFYTSRLGWLDGPKLAAPHVYAETRDGRRVLMPNTFFGIFSYPLDQTQGYIPPNSFPMRHGGSTKTVAEFRDANKCGPMTIPFQDTDVSLDAIKELVRNTDVFMRNHPQIKKYNLFYVYPHHMLSNPAMFSDFNKLTMDDIVGYHYVVDSVCLTVKNGHLARDVRKRWSTPITIQAG